MTSRISRDKIVNFVLYQSTWFLCVLLAARERPGVAAAITMAAVLVHLVLAEHTLSEVKLVAIAGAVGLVVDSFHVTLGVFSFAESGLVPWLCPPWIVAMWMLFAITLRSCMSWITKSLPIAAFVGFLGGPLSFVAGEKLGAVTFSDPRPLSLLVLGVVWASTLPLLTWVVAREPARRELAYRRVGQR